MNLTTKQKYLVFGGVGVVVLIAASVVIGFSGSKEKSTKVVAQADKNVKEPTKPVNAGDGGNGGSTVPVVTPKPVNEPSNPGGKTTTSGETPGGTGTHTEPVTNVTNNVNTTGSETVDVEPVNTGKKPFIIISNPEEVPCGIDDGYVCGVFDAKFTEFVSKNYKFFYSYPKDSNWAKLLKDKLAAVKAEDFRIEDIFSPDQMQTDDQKQYYMTKFREGPSNITIENIKRHGFKSCFEGLPEADKEAIIGTIQHGFTFVATEASTDLKLSKYEGLDLTKTDKEAVPEISQNRREKIIKVGIPFALSAAMVKNPFHLNGKHALYIELNRESLVRPSKAELLEEFESLDAYKKVNGITYGEAFAITQVTNPADLARSSYEGMTVFSRNRFSDKSVIAAIDNIRSKGLKNEFESQYRPIGHFQPFSILLIGDDESKLTEIFNQIRKHDPENVEVLPEKVETPPPPPPEEPAPVKDNFITISNASNKTCGKDSDRICGVFDINVDGETEEKYRVFYSHLAKDMQRIKDLKKLLSETKSSAFNINNIFLYDAPKTDVGHSYYMTKLNDSNTAMTLENIERLGFKACFDSLSVSDRLAIEKATKKRFTLVVKEPFDKFELSKVDDVDFTKVNPEAVPNLSVVHRKTIAPQITSTKFVLTAAKVTNPFHLSGKEALYIEFNRENYVKTYKEDLLKEFKSFDEYKAVNGITLTAGASYLFNVGDLVEHEGEIIRSSYDGMNVFIRNNFSYKNNISILENIVKNGLEPEFRNQYVSYRLFQPFSALLIGDSDKVSKFYDLIKGQFSANGWINIDYSIIANAVNDKVNSSSSSELHTEATSETTSETTSDSSVGNVDEKTVAPEEPVYEHVVDVENMPCGHDSKVNCGAFDINTPEKVKYRVFYAYSSLEALKGLKEALESRVKNYKFGFEDLFDSNEYKRFEDGEYLLSRLVSSDLMDKAHTLTVHSGFKTFYEDLNAGKPEYWKDKNIYFVASGEKVDNLKLLNGAKIDLNTITPEGSTTIPRFERIMEKKKGNNVILKVWKIIKIFRNEGLQALHFEYDSNSNVSYPYNRYDDFIAANGNGIWNQIIYDGFNVVYRSEADIYEILDTIKAEGFETAYDKLKPFNILLISSDENKLKEWEKFKKQN